MMGRLAPNCSAQNSDLRASHLNINDVLFFFSCLKIKLQKQFLH